MKSDFEGLRKLFQKSTNSFVFQITSNEHFVFFIDLFSRFF